MHRLRAKNLAPPSRLSGILTILAGFAYLALAAIQITHGAFDDQLTTTIDYLNDGTFVAGLLLSTVAIVALGAAIAAPRVAIALAVAGQLLVVVGVAAGLATGESPSWFAAVGVPGNLLALIGLTLLGRCVWRTKAFPVWIPILLILAVPLGVGVAEHGGSIVPGLLWLAVGIGVLRTVPQSSSRATPINAGATW